MEPSKNACKYGRIASTVLPEREAAQVQRRYASFRRKLNPTEEIGQALVL